MLADSRLAGGIQGLADSVPTASLPTGETDEIPLTCSDKNIPNQNIDELKKRALTMRLIILLRKG